MVPFPSLVLPLLLLCSSFPSRRLGSSADPVLCRFFAIERGYTHRHRCSHRYPSSSSRRCSSIGLRCFASLGARCDSSQAVPFAVHQGARYAGPDREGVSMVEEVSTGSARRSRGQDREFGAGSPSDELTKSSTPARFSLPTAQRYL